MLYPLALFAVLVGVAITGSFKVQAEADEVPSPPVSQQPQLQTPVFHAPPDRPQIIEVGASDPSLAEIAKWLSANYDLPYAAEQPRVERVSKLRLQQLRYRALLPSQSQAIGGEHATPLPEHQREVVAVYDDRTRTVFLPDSWTGASTADRSVLVHEMVHHLQNLAGQTFACAAEREKTAYLAQDQWLRLHGLELEKEFDVDMFTVVVLSACMN